MGGWRGARGRLKGSRSGWGWRGGRLQALEGGNRIAPEERGAQRRADGMREKDNSEYCGRRARDLPERK